MKYLSKISPFHKFPKGVRIHGFGGLTRVALKEIVGKMNNLFSGHITESDFIGAVTTWQGRLATNEKLAAQARNNNEEQFAMGDFKDAFTDIVIEAQDAHNNIADQLLKDERIFGVIQKMVAKMVWKQFQQSPAPPRLESYTGV